MKWIKYQVIQSTVDNEPILINKKVGYNEANLAIAQAEAYNGEYTVEEDSESFKEPLSQIVDLLYPVGTIYMSTDSTNPQTRWTQTKWISWGSGRVPVGVNASETEFATVEKTGGAKTHTLTTAQIPSHAHGLNNHTHSVPNHEHYTYTGTLYDMSKTGEGIGLKQDQTSSLKVDITTNTDVIRVSGTCVTGGASGNTAATGSGSAHNNLQPYITCYMWKRIE